MSGDNTFAGRWDVETGATLSFNDAGSVGLADIDVRDGGSLQIQWHWDTGAELTIADTTATSVDIGNYSWSVSSLVFGGSSVAGGTYTTSALNGLGANPVFTGSGIIRVMPAGTMVYSVTNNIAGTTQWLCPDDVTSIQVECWGGGGAGGSSSTLGAEKVYVAGGGAAGGAYARKSMVPVTPGNTYSVTIAPAAVALDPSTASTGDRVDGADISFTGDNGVTVLAKGGQGGQCVINPTATQGGVGGAGSSTGCISGGPGYVYAGGTGYFPPTKGGSNGGGEGGLGAGGVGNGGNGFTPGGGGGGARTGRWVVSSGDDLQKTGGTGGLGQIIISYMVLPEVVEPPVLGHSMSSGDLVFDWTGNGFKVQSRTNLTEGVWEDVLGGDTPPVTNSPVHPEAFFRLIEQ